MNINDNDETNLQINEKLERETFAAICNAILQLQQTITRAADYSAMIGYPDAQTTKRIHTAIIQLITATAETTAKLQHHQCNRIVANMPKLTNADYKNPDFPQSPPTNKPAKPITSATSHQNAPDPTNTNHVIDPLPTRNIDKLHEQLQRHK